MISQRRRRRSKEAGALSILSCKECVGVCEVEISPNLEALFRAESKTGAR